MAEPITRGEYAGVPYAAVGTGRPVVVLPGLSPTTGVASEQIVRGSLTPMRRLAARRTMVVLNRWPGLPRGLTMADLARRHADAIRAGFDEPVDVVGTSTGGSIAQQLAAEHPDVVHRLVLVSTGCRLGPVGRADQAEVADLLRAGDVRGAARSFGAGLVPRPLRALGGAAGWLAAHRVIPSETDAADLLATLDAEDGFDLRRCDGVITAPTLIVSGGRDRFYGRALVEETHRRIPRSHLHLQERRGHTTVLFDPRAARAIRTFLAD